MKVDVAIAILEARLPEQGRGSERVVVSVARKLFLDLPVPRKLVVMLWLFLVVVVGLLGLSYLTIETLLHERAYVGGEGLWSKAQKQARSRPSTLLNLALRKSFQGYQNALSSAPGKQASATGVGEACFQHELFVEV